MHRRHRKHAIALGLLLGLVLSWPSAQLALGQQGAVSFSVIDTDADGTITREEWANVGALDGVEDIAFEDLDVDDVAGISLAEFEYVFGTQKQTTTAVELLAPEASPLQDVPHFTDLDKNRDRILTTDEWSSFNVGFEAVDRDQSTTIDPSEYDVYALFQRTPPLFDEVDLNLNGQIGIDEWHLFEYPFEQVDQNSDGEVSRNEYEGFLSLFQVTKVIPAIELDVLPEHLERLVNKAGYLRHGKNYAELEPVLLKLVKALPDKLAYQYRLAGCYLELNRPEDARKVYQEIEARDHGNIIAKLAIARLQMGELAGLEAGPQRDERLQQIKTSLEETARDGGAVLEAVNHFSEFAELREDYPFLVRVIRAPQAYQVRPESRDPFRVVQESTPNPEAIDLQNPPEPEGLAADAQAELLAELEALLGELRARARANDFEGVDDVWKQIRTITAQASLFTDEELRDRLVALQQETIDLAPFVRSMLLTSFKESGDKMVAAMDTNYANQEYNRVFTIWEALQKHVEIMVSEGSDFHPAANDLLTAGSKIHADAQTMDEAGRIGLEVTAVVIGSALSRAVINNHVLKPGDPAKSPEGTIIPQLRVVRITKEKVTFTYRGLSFERKTPKRNHGY